MAKIPDITALGGRPSFQGSRSVVDIDTSAENQALANLGAAISTAGARIAQTNDQIVANDTRKQLNQWEADNLYDPTNGAIAKKGKDAFDLPTTLIQSFDKNVDSIRGGLTDPRQRVLFDEMANSRKAQIQQWLGQKVRQEHDNYAVQEYSAGMDSSRQRTATLALNPAAVDSELNYQKLATVAEMNRQGASPEAIGEAVREQEAKTHAVVLSSLLASDDFGSAMAYYSKYGSKMEPSQMLAAKKTIDDGMARIEAVKTVSGMLAKDGPNTKTNDFSRLTNLVMQQESGGRETNPDGSTVTSPKGAQGVMQVMPGTNKDPGFGVKPAQDNSPEERARVGRDYLQAMLERYNGNVQMALAAYNAGPATVDETIKGAQYNSEKEGKPVDWLTLMPKETQQYVSRIGNQYMAGAGANQKPTLSDLDAQLEKQYAGNPLKLTKMRDELHRQWDEDVKAVKQREDMATDEAFKTLDANGGNFDALPLTIRQNVPGDKLSSLREYADKVSKGQPVRTNWQVYYQLVSNPDTLATVNLGALRGSLGDAEFKELTNKQETLKTGDARGIRSQQQIVNNLLASAGIDPTPKDTDKAGQQSIGQFWSELEGRGVNKNTPPDQLRKAAASLLTEVEVNRPHWWNATRKVYQLQPTDNVVVPKDASDKITAALKQYNTQNPNKQIPISDAAIQAYYLTGLSR